MSSPQIQDPRRGISRWQIEIVVIGTSMGGLNALEILLKGLPGDFPVPLVIVQHRAFSSGRALEMALQRRCVLRVREPQDKEPIQVGYVYVAPADYHLLVEDGAFALSTEAPVCYSRPSIDVLFESAADSYAEKVVGIVLTGANSDGAQGAARIKARGGLVIVQAPGDAESRMMPQAAIAASPVDWVLPLAEIAALLIRLSRNGRRNTT